MVSKNVLSNPLFAVMKVYINMKQAWLCYYDEEDWEKKDAVFRDEQPNEFSFFKVVHIVYAVINEN